MDTPPKPTDPVAEFEAEFIAGLESEDDFAVRERLAAGKAVYYVEDDTPPGMVIKEYPSGKRQLVKHVRGNDQVIRDL
jgi:hypothetical protein